ncbi:MAG TPA: YqhA family protein, partial [Casimicrobiaceae bacterium]
IRGGLSLDDIAHVTVYAFKILDLFLIGTILYIVAIGLAALFLDGEAALPRWFKVHEVQDLKEVLTQAAVVALLVAFLGDVLEWEQGSDIAYVGGGIAVVIAALAYLLRATRGDRSP